MSPEQASGQSVGPPSDIFALGIVLYELTTGQHPFRAETVVGYLHAITLQTPPPPSRLRTGVPAAVDDLILGMLHKEARRRPTAAEVAEALREIERGTEKQGESQTRIIASSARRAAVPLRNTVGREQERNDLRAAFDQANAGCGSLDAKALLEI